LRNSIYLDTNVLIALFEGTGASHDSLWKLVSRAVGDTPALFHTSALSFTELLTKPYRDRNHVLARQYLLLARSEDWLSVWPVNPGVIELTAVIRARFRLKLPDAVHVATAVATSCQYFVTFDLGITDLMGLAHPITDESIEASIRVIRPDPVSLSELAQALS
jgi:predicted nucleic acid-binding protein